jgi:hypothetical protein
MIIINLMGGLGNQMFQYAAARSLAIASRTVLRIDPLNFTKRTLNKEHTFQLDSFRITAGRASREEIRKYRAQKGFRGFLARIAGRSLIDGQGMVFEEPAGSAFKSLFLELGPDRYLVGYFNSYKYFASIRDILLEEYVPKDNLSPEARKIVEQIEGTNSVGIHIRRGDYVDDPDVRKSIEGIITDRYYRNAIESISERVADPHFFVFSNDMDWVKANFRVPFKVTCVDINPPQKGYEDLWIMSRCRHAITAGGSTFSWWAAYLNRNPDKIVVRTERINNDHAYNHPEDYFPPEWEIAAS